MLDDNLLNILIEFQKLNSNIYIGGSVSLMLQGAIPFRIPKDIDIISPVRIHIFDVFNKPENLVRHRLARRIKFNNLMFELFINFNAEYIDFRINNNILKLSPIEEVFKWKLKEKNINNPKHLNDLNYYYK